MLWGKMSDIYGRRPMILLGLTFSIVANVAFGFSKTISALMLWRIIAGMANGTLGVMRTMTAEFGGRKHHSRAFLAPPVVFNSGRVIALAIGGCLANPIENMHTLFGPEGLFNISRNPRGVAWMANYPYALPSLFNGTTLTICLVAATLWLRETFPTRMHHRDPGLALGNKIKLFINRGGVQKPEYEYALIRPSAAEADTTPNVVSSGSVTMAQNRRPFGDIWIHQVMASLLAFALLSFHNATFLHTFTVFLSMPAIMHQMPHLYQFEGGLGLATPAIGLFLATIGIAGILLQLFIYPKIHQRLGALGVFRLASAIFPISYVFAPYLALLADHHFVKWIAMAAILWTQVLARTMAIPSSVILLTEAAPHRNVLGTVHGAGNTLSALGSALGPAIAGLLMAKSLELKAIGLMWWAWLLPISITSLLWSFMLKKM